MVVSTRLPLTSAAVVADPYPYFAEARSQASVQWHEDLGMCGSYVGITGMTSAYMVMLLVGMAQAQEPRTPFRVTTRKPDDRVTVQLRGRDVLEGVALDQRRQRCRDKDGVRGLTWDNATSLAESPGAQPIGVGHQQQVDWRSPARLGRGLRGNGRGDRRCQRNERRAGNRLGRCDGPAAGQAGRKLFF